MKSALEGELLPDLALSDGGVALDVMGVREDVMRLMAKYADIKPHELRALLFRLADQPDRAWPKNGPEALVQRFITVAGLPPILTLIDEWSASLKYTGTDVNAVLEGVHPAVILPILALPEGLDRDDVLIRAWDGGWGVEQTRVAVREMWTVLAVPPTMLAALDQLTAALSDPALVQGSARYASLRRAISELEQRCREAISEQESEEKAWRELGDGWR